MKNYIKYPLVEGVASRQAHTDLPAGTYEREMSKEGFFGPASFFYHRHPPTAWSNFEGPLRPHAFDLGKVERVETCPLECHQRVREYSLQDTLLENWRHHGLPGAQRRRR